MQWGGGANLLITESNDNNDFFLYCNYESACQKQKEMLRMGHSKRYDNETA